MADIIKPSIPTPTALIRMSFKSSEISEIGMVVSKNTLSVFNFLNTATLLTPL